MRRDASRLAPCFALAVVLLSALALVGHVDLALYLAPLAAVAVLLLSGRFVGEERIVARWLAGRPRAGRRPASARWSPWREHALASQLERSALTLRGPPHAARAAA